MRFFSLLTLAMCATAVIPRSSSADEQAFLSADLGLSIFGETGNRENLFRSFSTAARGGIRWGRWGAYLHVEPAFWRAAEGKDEETWSGVLNLGIGGEYLYADGFVKTAITLGPSIILTGTAIDTIGQTGFFLDIRPTGLRWSVWENLTLGLEPFALAITVPALDGIPLVEIAYRTTISGEYLF